MTFFQILMLGASAFFAYKIYEHINTLKDAQEGGGETRSADAFSLFDSSTLIEKADEEMQNGNLDKALAIYSEANIKEPNNDETLFKMGYTLAKQKRYEEALEYFKEALLLDKNNPFTHLEIAQIYIEQKELASAKTHLNAALEIDADFAPAKEALQKIDGQA